MSSGFKVRPNQYFDSIFLMGVNKRLSAIDGVRQSAVLMGSPANKRLLADIGISGEGVDVAGPNDLLLAVVADTSQIVEDALGRSEAWIEGRGGVSPARTSVRTQARAVADRPDANLAVLSIAGEYAAAEARKALKAGLHVFLFSSNVPLEDEIALKRQAAEQGLLVMGPDCGTSLIGGKGLGLANAVRRGAIGVIASAGTGLQEFACQVHNAGFGISHAIGTGSRDLSAAVGGLSTFAALEALARDPGTEVIALLSKPPAPETLRRLLTRLEESGKPIVGCFFGARPETSGLPPSVQLVQTIDEAAQTAIGRAQGAPVAPSLQLTPLEKELANSLRARRSHGQIWLRGVLSGGTFCYQAQQILRGLGLEVRSNTPLDQDLGLEDPNRSLGHAVIDMGDEYFTLARPHPMIDGTLRRERILAEGRDPELAVLLLDIVLGFNASMDPVGELSGAIIESRRSAQAQGRDLAVVASVCGTDGDPQDLAAQAKMLEDAGAVVFSSNARAVLFSAALLD